MRDTRADLLVEQQVVALVVHEDLGAHDACEAVVFLRDVDHRDADVALPEVGERVIDDELQALVQHEIEALLQFLLVHRGSLSHIASKITALLVEEDLHALEAVLLPQEVLVLHPVLAILLLRTGIELRRGRQPGHPHQDQHGGHAVGQEGKEACAHGLKLALNRPEPSAMVRISGISDHATRRQIHLQPLPGEHLRGA